jgi:hypothetical protein
LTTVRKLRAVQRLLVVALAAALVLLASPAATAAVVPMCGENAQSIAAPPILKPGKGHVLERLPCPERDAFELGRGSGDGPRPIPSLIDDAPQRVCPTPVHFPRVPRVARLSITQERLWPQSAYVGVIERPPRHS